MHIAFGRISTKHGHLYKHHGVIISLNLTTRTYETVEFLAKCPGLFTKLFVSSNRSSKGSIIKVNRTFRQRKSVYRYDYNGNSFHPHEVKRRAEILASISTNLKYALWRFNCEHFASFIIIGLAFSKQIGHINADETEKLKQL